MKYGKILRIGLPKTKTKNDDTINNGFAFVEFENPQQALKAIDSTNNKIPQLIMDSDYGEKLGLKVMLKKNWQEKKLEFKQLLH